jgi:RHS repeat-associated protein
VDWGALKQVRRPNDTRTTHGYTGRGWIDGIIHEKIGWPHNQLLQFDYYDSDVEVRDWVGNPMRVTVWRGAFDRSIHFRYDHGYRLVREYARSGVGAGLYDSGYTYDEVGNLTGKDELGADRYYTYTYDNDNRLGVIWRHQAGQPAQLYGQFAYDADGNMTHRFLNGNSGWLTWGSLGELVSTSGSLGSRTFGYDAFGQRWRAQQSGGWLRNEVWDGRGLVCECDGGWNTTALYTHGPTGLLNQNRGGSAGDTRWYHADGLGSVWALTNSVGNVTDKYAYNAYGETIYQTGTTENHARFVGAEGYFDDLNGLQLLGHRYYDPQLKRFITQDPIGLAGGDLNFYAYCGSNPLTGIDPWGLQDAAEHIIPQVDPRHTYRASSFVSILRNSPEATRVPRRGGIWSWFRGRVGEDSVMRYKGWGRNNDKFTADSGRKRRPDVVTSESIVEIKHLSPGQTQYYTHQLKDLLSIAKKEGKKLELWINTDAELSGPLTKWLARYEKDITVVRYTLVKEDEKKSESSE